MNCQKCGKKGVLNHALGKEFWYCRECKIEIVVSPEAPTTSTPPKEKDKWDYWGGGAYSPGTVIYSPKPKFKPGDRVRVLHNIPGAAAGQEGRVIRAMTTTHQTIIAYIIMKDNSLNAVVYEDEIELVALAPAGTGNNAPVSYPSPPSTTWLQMELFCTCPGDSHSLQCPTRDKTYD